MDDALLMRVLHRVADVDHQLDALAGTESVAVAVFRDRDAVHELHHEVRPPGLGRARVVHPRDAG